MKASDPRRSAYVRTPPDGAGRSLFPPLDRAPYTGGIRPDALRGLEMNGPDIAVNRRMETGKQGVYAAGDCTGPPYQLTKAVGEGNEAAHSILEYLAE